MKPKHLRVMDSPDPFYYNGTKLTKSNAMATKFHISEHKLLNEGFIKECYYDKDDHNRRINNIRIEVYTYSITDSLAIEVVYGYKMLEGAWALRDSSIELTSEGTNTALFLTTLDELILIRNMLTPKG